MAVAEHFQPIDTSTTSNSCRSKGFLTTHHPDKNDKVYLEKAMLAFF